MPTGKNKAGKHPAKTAPGKPKKKKRPAKDKPPGKVAVHVPEGAEQNNQRDAEKRVAAMREKLKKSLDNPEMRDQIVRIIRTMLNEGR